MRVLAASVAVTIAATCSAMAQQQPQPAPRRIEQQVKVEQGKSTRIAVFVSAKADCTSGPLPIIRLAQPPSGGTVTIRRGKMRVTNFKSCLAAEFPAYVAYYKSKPEFSGTDAVTLEVRNDKGTIVQIRKFDITVAASAQDL